MSSAPVCPKTNGMHRSKSKGDLGGEEEESNGSDHARVLKLRLIGLCAPLRFHPLMFKLPTALKYSTGHLQALPLLRGVTEISSVCLQVENKSEVDYQDVATRRQRRDMLPRIIHLLNKLACMKNANNYQALLWMLFMNHPI